MPDKLFRVVALSIGGFLPGRWIGEAFGNANVGSWIGFGLMFAFWLYQEFNSGKKDKGRTGT